ncbi:MAG: hypothetical protein WCC97_07685 [Candidatus Acidiferrales bacterium]
MPQLLFSAITLFAKMVLAEGSTHRHRKVPQVVHAYAIGGAISDQSRGNLRLRGISQKDAGDPPFSQMQHFQIVPALPVRRGIFSQHYVVIFRLQTRGKLVRGENYVHCNLKVSPPQLLHTSLYVRYISVNKEDTQRQPPACRAVQGRRQFGLFEAIS